MRVQVNGVITYSLWRNNLVAEHDDQKKFINLLRLAYSAELAAAYAYRGHWHSVSDADERAHIRQIENEEWHHRQLVGEMLDKLQTRPSRVRELRAAIVGRALGFLCHFTGWLAPMYGAGRLESRNIREYETAARYARAAGHEEFVDCLLTMAEVEWEHEKYFRSRVLLRSLGRRLSLWPQPPPRETIRKSFAECAQSASLDHECSLSAGGGVEVPLDVVVISQHAE
ncbi:MAG TPA: demethoxyubiquinone hydroxylase family protein [Pyrinomonadaceae bacterium]|nr:demethoxyubiquinone hydroxylase family protein [Pyrinomonadaceae bacterium]